MEFSITVTRGSDPNTGAFTVFNLDDDLRALIEADHKGVEFRIAPNPVDDLVLVFRGTTTNVNTDPSSLDDATTIIAGEGAKELTRVFFNRTYSPGTTLSMIIDDLAAEMGMPVNSSRFGTDTAIIHPLVLSGRASACMHKIARDYDLVWSIRAGVIEIQDKYGVKPRETDAVWLTMDTGLIQYPELIEVEEVGDLFGKAKKTDDNKEGKTEKKDPTQTIGARFVSLFNPQITPGRILACAESSRQNSIGGQEDRRLGDLGVTGLYRCDKFTITGSTRPRACVMDIEARRTDGKRA
jgi:hypothetical protein